MRPQNCRHSSLIKRTICPQHRVNGSVAVGGPEIRTRRRDVAPDRCELLVELVGCAERVFARTGERDVVQLPLDPDHLLLDQVDLLEERFGVGDGGVASRRGSVFLRVTNFLVTNVTKALIIG